MVYKNSTLFYHHIYPCDYYISSLLCIFPGTTALHYLARRNVSDAEKNLYLDILRLTADNGADLESATALGERPLHHAAMSCNITATKFLIERGEEGNKDRRASELENGRERRRNCFIRCH